MIEIGLYFALGFLIATLLGLLIMPAVWRRAVRLTRRQIEATTPLTRAEILADRDQIAAEHAVSIRRFEMGIAALRLRVADQMATVTRQGDQIRALGAERDAARAEIERLTERLAAHAAREKGLDLTLDKMEALERENRRLAEERAAASAELRKLEDRARDISRDHDAANDELRSLLYRLEQAEAKANARVAAIQQQLDQRTAELAEAERITAEAKAARVEAAARLASGATEIASLRAEREALTLKLAAFQTGSRLAATTSDATTPGSNVSATIDDLERQRADLDRRLADMAAERDALRAQLADMERRLDTPERPSTSDPDFAALRRALTDFGERFAATEPPKPIADLPPPLAPADFTAPVTEPAPATVVDEAAETEVAEADDAGPTRLPPASFPFGPAGGPFGAGGDDAAPSDEDPPRRSAVGAEPR